MCRSSTATSTVYILFDCKSFYFPATPSHAPPLLPLFLHQLWRLRCYGCLSLLYFYTHIIWIIIENHAIQEHRWHGPEESCAHSHWIQLERRVRVSCLVWRVSPRIVRPVCGVPAACAIHLSLISSISYLQAIRTFCTFRTKRHSDTYTHRHTRNEPEQTWIATDWYREDWSHNDCVSTIFYNFNFQLFVDADDESTNRKVEQKRQLSSAPPLEPGADAFAAETKRKQEEETQMQCRRLAINDNSLLKTQRWHITILSGIQSDIIVVCSCVW